MNYQRAEAQAEGENGIFPGNRIVIKAVDSRFSGTWLVERVVHDCSNEIGGFTTTVYLKRNKVGDDNDRGSDRSVSAIEQERVASEEGENLKKSNASSSDTNSQADLTDEEIVIVELSRSKYPESVEHIENAIKNGAPSILTISRKTAKSNRKISLKGLKKVPGKDLDEYPPAMFKEGGLGADVKPISPSDNRGSGSTTGHKLKIYPEGTKIQYKIIE